MSISTNLTGIRKWALVIGVLTAIAAGFTTKTYAENPPEAGISHEEVVDLLAYLWDNGPEEEIPIVTIYDYQFQEIYHGELKDIADHRLLSKSDLLLTDGNHTIYLVEQSN